MGCIRNRALQQGPPNAPTGSAPSRRATQKRPVATHYGQWGIAQGQGEGVAATAPLSAVRLPSPLWGTRCEGRPAAGTPNPCTEEGALAGAAQPGKGVKLVLQTFPPPGKASRRSGPSTPSWPRSSSASMGCTTQLTRGGPSRAGPGEALLCPGGGESPGSVWQ